MGADLTIRRDFVEPNEVGRLAVLERQALHDGVLRLDAEGLDGL